MWNEVLCRRSNSVICLLIVSSVWVSCCSCHFWSGSAALHNLFKSSGWSTVRINLFPRKKKIPREYESEGNQLRIAKRNLNLSKLLAKAKANVKRNWWNLKFDTSKRPKERKNARPSCGWLWIIHLIAWVLRRISKPNKWCGCRCWKLIPSIQYRAWNYTLLNDGCLSLRPFHNFFAVFALIRYRFPH